MDQKNVVFRTLNFMEATLIKSLLEGSGIEVFTFDENISRLNPFYSSLVGGIKLLVADEDIDAAKDILREYRSREGQDPHTGRSSALGADVSSLRDNGDSDL